MKKAIVLAAALSFAASAQAANKVKVGFVSTLSGPSAALGVDIRDAFQLAIKLNGGKLGGLPAEVLIADDQFIFVVITGTEQKADKLRRIAATHKIPLETVVIPEIFFMLGVTNGPQNRRGQSPKH